MVTRFSSIFMLLSMKAVRKAFVLIYPREDWVWLEQYLPQDSVKGESLWTTQQVPREIVQVVNSLQWRSDHSLFCLGHWVWWKLEDPVIHCLNSIRHRTTPKRLPTSRPFPSFVELSAFSIADFLHHSSPELRLTTPDQSCFSSDERAKAKQTCSEHLFALVFLLRSLSTFKGSYPNSLHSFN